MAQRGLHEQEHVVGQMDDRLAAELQVLERASGVKGQKASSLSPQRTPIAAQLTTPSLPIVVTTVSISGT